VTSRRAPLHASDRRRFAPVFVLTAPRSYSSVITSMLGQHPNLLGLPELKLFLYPTIGELDASLPAELRRRGVAHRSPGLVRAIAHYVFGDQSSASVREALHWLRERADWTGADVLDYLLALAHPVGIVEKTPETATDSATLQRLSAAYERARYVHLVRHPNTWAGSLHEHWKRTMPMQCVPNPAVMCHTLWLATHQRILHFAAELPDNRYLRVRAEDVLNDSDHQLRRIAGWLGVRDDADAVEAMRHPEASPFARFGPAGTGVVGGHDHGFLSDPLPRKAMLPPSVELPAGWTGGHDLWANIVGLANEFGYTHADVSQPQPRGEAAA